jgi:hypothetical protein
MSRKWIRFVGPNARGELAIYRVGQRLSLAARFCSKEYSAATELF